MTLYEFNLLDEIEQANIVWNDGVYLASIIKDDYYFVLYQIDGFYVEIKYDVFNNKLLLFSSFSSIHRLEPYLREIDISNIS